MEHLVFLEIMIIFLLESNGKESREGDKMNKKVEFLEDAKVKPPKDL
jgi:hypothetical protein